MHFLKKFFISSLFHLDNSFFLWYHIMARKAILYCMHARRIYSGFMKAEQKNHSASTIPRTLPIYVGLFRHLAKILAKASMRNTNFKKYAGLFRQEPNVAKRSQWARSEKQLITVFHERSQQSKELAKRVYRATINDYATWQGTSSWKFVGQADGKIPKPLENTDYFATAKIAKLPTSNAISNTF